MIQSKIKRALAAGCELAGAAVSWTIPHLAIFKPVGWLATCVMSLACLMTIVSLEYASSRPRLIANVVVWWELPAILCVLFASYLEYQNLRSVADARLKDYAGVTITVVAGLMLFAMRAWYRIAYGLTEALVGVYLAWVKWTTTTGPLAELSKDTLQNPGRTLIG